MEEGIRGEGLGKQQSMEWCKLPITSWKAGVEWKKHSGPEVQKTWVRVYSPVLTGYIS